MLSPVYVQFLSSLSARVLCGAAGSQPLSETHSPGGSAQSNRRPLLSPHLSSLLSPLVVFSGRVDWRFMLPCCSLEGGITHHLILWHTALTMTDQFTHELKLDRAVEHLESLKREVERWLGRHPYFLASNFDPQRGEYSIWIDPRGEPPPEIGILIGDCLHNLRSALDSLVYDLGRVCQGGPLPPDVAKKSEFPIYIDPDEFRKFRKRKIGAIPPRAQAKIKRLQPYNEWESFRGFMKLMGMRMHPEAYHPLWLLQELSNIDKHRERHLTLFAAPTVMYGGQNIAFADPVVRDAASIKDRAKMLSYRPVDPGGEVDVEFSFAFNVAFEEGPPAFGEPVDRVLLRVYTFINREVLPALTPYLTRH